MRDPEAVEALRAALDPDLEHARREPARLEHAVGEQRERDEREAGEPDSSCEPRLTAPGGDRVGPGSAAAAQRTRRRERPALRRTASRSTGATETTWRLNFSSESVRPAATPTSCERCRIGIAKSLPVCFFSFDCQASSERWQSGHGVTIASAPASIACSIGWISSASAVSSRAWMIGKPQHLILAG